MEMQPGCYKVSAISIAHYNLHTLSIDLNQIRFQYDKMREANTDLQAAGGAPLADGALITLLDAAIARNHNYDTIRMFVSRANHETFLAHFTDYVHQVRSEMQMTEVANENGPHAAAYPAVTAATNSLMLILLYAPRAEINA